MPRGGPRKGTPGKGYANRTDLGQSPNMQRNTAATGGMAAPPPPQQPQGQMPTRFPEDSPMLTDPTQRPGEPITAGLPTGDGPGPGALDPRLSETAALQKYLPLIAPFLDDPETPQSVKALVTYIRGA